MKQIEPRMISTIAALTVMFALVAGRIINFDFTHVYRLIGGMNVWNESGYQLIHR